MARNDPFGMTRDARGNFKRTVGKKRSEDGNITQATFYLGRDRAVASINVGKLLRCWDAIHDGWYRDRQTETPLWDETTFTIGKAVALGKEEVEVVCPLNPSEVGPDFGVVFGVWLSRLQGQFPMIRVKTAGWLQDHANDLADIQQDKHEKLAKIHGKMADLFNAAKTEGHQLRAKGPSLSEALASYEAHVRERYTEGDGLTEWGGRVLDRVEHVRSHLGNSTTTLLSSVTGDFLNEWVGYWRKRPKTKKNKPCSRSWAKTTIWLIRDFVDWLDGSDLGWQKPRGYKVKAQKIKETSDELAKDGVPVYTLSELTTLWQYAIPRVRCWILLGLNCGFGAGEVSTLRKSHIKEHDGVTYIVARRNKTGVLGKWKLWPETAAALKWYLANDRPESDSPLIFLTDEATALNQKTEGGNRKQTVPNAWSRLDQRIRKDHATFNKLSFNKLRKTGSNWIRQSFKQGSELADLHLAHGERTMVDHYTNKPFKRLFKIHGRMRDWLAPMFNAVTEPFVVKTAGKGALIISRATIRRVQELRRQGHTQVWVAKELKISRGTVARAEKVVL